MNAPKKEKSHDQQVRKDAFKKLGMILLAVLFAVNTIQLARFGEIVERVDSNNKGVIDEIGGVRDDMMMYGNDLNEIRQFLLLPTREYSFMKAAVETEEADEKETSRTESALYAFLGQISEEQSVEKNSRKAVELAGALVKDVDFAEQLKKASLQPGAAEETEDAVLMKISDQKGQALFSLIAEKKTAAVKVQSILGTQQIKEGDVAAVKTEIVDYVTKNAGQVLQMKETFNRQKGEIEALMKNGSAVNVLKEKKLNFSTPEDADEALNYNVINAEGKALLTIGIQRKDGLLAFDGAVYENVQGLQQKFIDKLQTLDGSSEIEKMINGRRSELETVLKEAAFQDLLKNSGLTAETSPREDYNKLLYDVKDTGGKTVFSFAIEMSSGMLKVLKDNQEIDLYSIVDEGSKKKP